MTNGSFFTGFGMFDYAAMRAGIETKYQIEINEFCQKLLNVRFPDAQKFRDIKEVRGRDLEYVNIISGGDPCQPSSIAGKRRGKEDDRYLWPEMFRLLCELKEDSKHPAWIINENVTGTISNAILDQKIIDLESIGYSTQAFIIPAAAVNAVHKRDRIWLIAHTENERHGRGSNQQSGLRERNIFKEESEGYKIRSEVEGCNREPYPDSDSASTEHEIQTGRDLPISDPTGEGLERNHGNKPSLTKSAGRDRIMPDNDKINENDGRFDTGEFRSQNWYEVATQLCRVDVSPSSGLLKHEYRKQRLEGLGNGIQWDVAYIFFNLIKQRDCDFC